MEREAGTWTLLAIDLAACFVAAPDGEIMWLENAIGKNTALKAKWSLDKALARGYTDVRDLDIVAPSLLELRETIAAAFKLHNGLGQQESESEDNEPPGFLTSQYTWGLMAAAVRNDPEGFQNHEAALLAVEATA